MLKTSFFLLFWLVLGAFVSLAQPRHIQFNHIKFDPHVQRGNIAWMQQDQQGFLWLATTEGLLRYDGYTFRTFRNDPTNLNSPACNWINPSSFDSAGNLWLATGCNGFDCFDIRNERFTHYSFDPLHPERLPSDNVQCVYVDKGGYVWIGTERGLARFDPRTRNYLLFQHDPGDSSSLSNNSVSCVTEDSRGNLWIGTFGGGLERLDSERKQFVHFRNSVSDVTSLSNNTIRYVYEDRRHVLWISTEAGVNAFNPVSGKFTRYLHDPANENSISQNIVYRTVEDSQGNIWMATWGGLNILDNQRTQWTRCLNNPSDPQSISDNSLAMIYIDHSGNVWIGSRNGTLDKWSPSKQKFSLHRFDDNPAQKFPYNIIWAFMKDAKNRLWVGTQNGIQVLDTAFNVLGRYTPNERDPHSLVYPTVRAFLQDRKGRIWIGTAQGAELYNEKENTFFPVLHEGIGSDHETDGAIATFYQDSSGTMWIGTQSRGIITITEEEINRWLKTRNNSSEPQYARYFSSPSSKDSSSPNSIRSLFEDRSHELWCGAVEGLTRVNRRTMQFERIHLDQKNPRGLNDNRIMTIIGDPTDETILWLGTFQGLIKFNKASGTVQRFTEHEGLANNLIYGILADSQGNLWMSTNNGISKFNSTSESFRNYTVDDGLQGTEYNRGAYYQNRSGKMFFGGMQGFNYFMPGEIKDNTTIPRIAFTSFEVDDRPFLLPQNISYTKEVVLPWESNHFSFEFTALEFTNPELNRYAYKLEGYDKEWVYSGARRFESYTHLNPGEYSFMAKGSNNENLWNEAGTSVKIVILPPYWQTWWFRILVVAAIAGVLIAFYKYRVNKLLDLERLRFRISSDLHDDLGSNLGSIALVTDMVRERFAKDEFEHRQLEEVSRTARQMTEAMKDIVWVINPEYGTMDDVLSRMKDVANTMLAQIHHTFEVSGVSSSRTVSMEFKRNFLLIYKECLHNIVKHSRAKAVDIRIEQRDGAIAISIHDNGTGFDELTVKRGNGLRNIRKRAEQIGGILEVNSTPGKGTSVILKAKII